MHLPPLMERASEWNAWSIATSDYPHGGTDGDRLAFLARYASLAPSSHNAQPWRFNVRRDRLELVADRTRSLPASDPDDRELVIGCGAALFHLRVAAEHFGRTPVVQVLPDSSDPDLLATVHLGAAQVPTPERVALFHAIARRRTNRRPFARRPLPEKLVEELRRIAILHDARLRPIHGEPKEALAVLIGRADRVQMRDALFRRELAAWLRANRDDNVDGMPGFAYGLHDARSRFEPIIVRTFEHGEGRAAHDRELAEGAPLLAVLTTRADTPRSWIAAGEALAHLVLHACSEDVAASFLNQPLELPELRGEVAALLGFDAAPQLILRMGYGPEVPATPRRPLWEMLRRFD